MANRKKANLPKKITVYRRYDEGDGSSWLIVDEDYSPNNLAHGEIVGHYELKSVAMIHKKATEAAIHF